MNKMGKCQSRKKFNEGLTQQHSIELEKTLQMYLNEKDEYKEKYESTNKKYLQVKSQLEKSLRTGKDLRRQLSLSEENASSLYMRYAIETDLNRRLRESQKQLEEEKKRRERSSGVMMDGRELTRPKQERISRESAVSSSEILQRLQDFEERICRIECIKLIEDGS